jgi:abhydrolase domain-containing protein 6
MMFDLLHYLIKLRLNKIGFRSQFADLDSCRLHYLQRRHGSKDILFIHGIGTSSSTWIRILPSLNIPDTITCIDLPGYGYSRISTEQPYFSLKELDDTLEKFVQQKLSHPLTLVGHSLGGWLAARYAFKYPSLIRHLIVINNAGIYYPGIEKQAEAFQLHNVGDTRKLLHKLWFNYPWYFEPFAPSIHRIIEEKHIGEFISSINKMDFINVSFSGLTMPVDVIWGEEDKLISGDSVEVMKKLLPSIKIHYIPSCGHVPQLEQSGIFSSLLNEILNR